MLIDFFPDSPNHHFLDSRMEPKRFSEAGTFASETIYRSKFVSRRFNLMFLFAGTGFGVPNWDFLGSTMVTSNYIRLTSDDRSRQGAIWNKVATHICRFIILT